MAPVGADHQIRLHFGGAIAAADYAPVALDQRYDFRLHAQREAGIARRLRREELEEVPLRHHGDEAAARRQAAEIGHRHVVGAELGADLGYTIVGQREQLVEQAELGDHLEGGRMQRVAAEVA